jgi:hypothetical protein
MLLLSILTKQNEKGCSNALIRVRLIYSYPKDLTKRSFDEFFKIILLVLKTNFDIFIK